MVAQPYEEIHYIEDTIGNQHGTVFVTQIGRHNINTLFDTDIIRLEVIKHHDTCYQKTPLA